MVATKSSRYGPGLTLISTDDGYGSKLMAGGQNICGWRLEIVIGWDEVTQFKVVPKGWMMEPIICWAGLVSTME